MYDNFIGKLRILFGLLLLQFLINKYLKTINTFLFK